MRGARKSARWGSNDPGQSLYLIAAGMVFLLGISGVAIDLTTLYLARSEAQRAADAAALAGAYQFVTSGYTTGLVTWAAVKTLAANQAATTGNQNLVGGQSPGIDTTKDVSWPCEATGNCSTDPRITVNVQMTSARGDAMPTYFMKIFGVTSANISATATAEAYAPSGGTGPAVGTSCVKPWVLPNVDTNFSGAGTPPGNPACPALPGTPVAMTNLNWCYPTGAPSTYFDTFVNPTANTVTNPGRVGSGGAVGEMLVVKPGQPSAAPVPSQFYPIQIPPGDAPAQCPSCANTGGGGAALYENNIECCNTDQLTCNQTTPIDTKVGNMQGPTEHGVECLINEDSNSGTGQDTLCGTSVLTGPATCGPPFKMYAGSNNPLVVKGLVSSGSVITSSTSVVTVPLYSGQTLQPGNSSPTITIIGFLQVFIDWVDTPGANQGNVHVTVLNISACGSSSGGGGGGGGGSGTITGGGGQLVPVRLVQPG